MKNFFTLFLLMIFNILPCFSLEDLDFKNGFISDNAKIITEKDYGEINNLLFELQKKTTADIAVVTVNSLQGKSVEDTAVEIGRQYQVGAKDSNNGVVILVAPNERKARIEVGMGLESEITNTKADTIMNSDMVPYFSKNEYSKGIYKGVASTATIIANSYGVTLDNTANAPKKITNSNSSSPREKIPFWAWAFILVMLPFTRGRGGGKRGRFGGGGGFSGGRGSSGSW